jgi:hypothetical protein
MRQEEKRVFDSQTKSLEELPKHNFSAFLSIIARICNVRRSYLFVVRGCPSDVLTPLLLRSMRRRWSATSGPTAISTRFAIDQLLLADLNEGGGGLGGGRLSGPAVSLESPLLVRPSSSSAFRHLPSCQWGWFGVLQPAYVQLLEALCLDPDRGCQQVSGRDPPHTW